MSPNASSGALLTRSIAHSSVSTPIRAASVALAVAITAASAQFTTPLPFTDVPFVLTPMVVLLAGATLGSRLGMLSQVLYLLAGAVGMQVFAPSVTLPPGALRLVGPTGGYLLAYPIAAFATGWLAERGWDRRYLSSLAAMLAGLVVIYLGGLAWRLGLVGSFDLAIATSVAPFVLPDILKLVAAAMILPGASRFVDARR
jgi:biotin transport system substrate-specific component